MSLPLITYISDATVKKRLVGELKALAQKSRFLNEIMAVFDIQRTTAQRDLKLLGEPVLLNLRVRRKLGPTF